MSKNLPSPAELRAMFGANLRKLSEDYRSISDLAKQLGINRTQFNRYLAGESFPRPDVLARVCAFFNVDARVLLEPVENIDSGQDPIANSFLRDFITTGAIKVPEDLFPSGFYRFSRRSFTRQDEFILGVLFVKRDGPNTFVRGYEQKFAMAIQGLPMTPRSREYRGIVMRQEDGIVFLASRRNAMTSTVNYLRPAPSFDNNYWVGYITRTVPEAVGELRVTRMVFEHLGRRAADALPHARAAGLRNVDDLPPFHRRLLAPDTPFA